MAPINKRGWEVDEACPMIRDPDVTYKLISELNGPTLYVFLLRCIFFFFFFF